MSKLLTIWNGSASIVYVIAFEGIDQVDYFGDKMNGEVNKDTHHQSSIYLVFSKKSSIVLATAVFSCQQTYYEILLENRSGAAQLIK
jgi:hypothetical protein